MLFRSLFSLTDVYSLSHHISNILSLCVPLDVVGIATHKSIRSAAIVCAEMTDNMTTWSRSVMSKASLSKKLSCIYNVVSCSTMLGVVGVSNWDTVTYSLDNSVESRSVLDSHVIKILRDMAM